MTPTAQQARDIMGQVYHIKTREEFGRLASPSSLSPLRAEPVSRLGADAFRSTIAAETDPDEAYQNAVYREIEDAMFWMGIGASAALWLVALVMAVRA